MSTDIKEDALSGPDLDTEAAKGLVSPVIRGMRLLRYIAEGGSTANLSEVGRLIDVNRVTITRLLATLEHEGLIERLPQGGHRIGMAFLTMAASGLGSVDLLSAGRRVIQQLSHELGVSAYLVVRDQHHVIYVHREMPEAGFVTHIRVGSRVPAFLTAPGRAMLAMLPNGTQKRLWDAWMAEGGPEASGRPAVSTDFASMSEELAQVSRQGIALSYSGYEAGINACAAAIHNQGQPVAAVSLVAPQPVFDADPELSGRLQSRVKQAAHDLSRLAGS